MGKKKVINKTEDLAKERETLTQSKLSKKLSAKRVPRINAYIQSTYNNTLITLTDPKGNVLAWGSSGRLGFKGAKKATPFAASKIVSELLLKLKKLGLEEVSIFVKGIGSGREAAIRAFGNQGIVIDSIRDITPVPHNGCRPRKVRRV